MDERGRTRGWTRSLFAAEEGWDTASPRYTGRGALLPYLQQGDGIQVWCRGRQSRPWSSARAGCASLWGKLSARIPTRGVGHRPSGGPGRRRHRWGSGGRSPAPPAPGVVSLGNKKPSIGPQKPDCIQYQALYAPDPRGWGGLYSAGKLRMPTLGVLTSGGGLTVCARRVSLLSLRILYLSPAHFDGSLRLAVARNVAAAHTTHSPLCRLSAAPAASRVAARPLLRACGPRVSTARPGDWQAMSYEDARAMCHPRHICPPAIADGARAMVSRWILQSARGGPRGHTGARAHGRGGGGGGGGCGGGGGYLAVPGQVPCETKWRGAQSTGWR